MAASNRECVVASISRIVSQAEIPKPIGTRKASPVQESSVQKWIKSVRTDLDAFSEVEIRAIYRHGVEVGAAVVNPLRDSQELLLDAPIVWDPIAGTTLMGDLPKDVNKQYEDLPRKLYNIYRGVQSTDARQPNLEEIAELKEAGRTKLRLWDSSDPLCWAMLLLALTVITTVLGLLVLNGQTSVNLSLL